MNFRVLCLVLACFVGTAVRGQANNYLLFAYNAAVAMKAEYLAEIEYWSEALTVEADDMGYYYTNLVAEGLERATTEAQGAAISRCANQTVYYCELNINYLSNEIRAAGDAAVELHNSVNLQLREMNIKEYDLELFYYYHSYKMQEAYEALWGLDGFSDRMFYEWIWVLIDFFYNYDDLYYCIDEVVSFD